jgi:gas vesicle protein
MAEHDNSGETVLAFLLGGVVGAAIGILLAPSSGEETRRKIGDWLDESRKKAGDFVEEKREILHAKKEQVSAAWEAGKKAYQDAGGSQS